MRRQSQERNQAEARRRRALEVAALALLLRRRQAAASDALARSGDPFIAIAGAVREAILAARAAGRAFARSDMAARFGVEIRGTPLAALVDAERAAIIARRHAEHVRKATAVAGGDPAASVSMALESTQRRAAVIAATETASAANAEADVVVRQVSLELGLDLWKRWNAYADACPVCIALDGETVRASESFSAGSPGSVHPSCRCWFDIIDEHGRIAA